MKKTLLVFFLTTAVGSFGNAQTQIGNSNFENWETITGSDEEPTNWNSFLTAGGTFSWAASSQLEQSSTVRPGSTGTKSARIFSRSAMGIIANGLITTGKVNMGSATPSDPANYNTTVTSDAAFSEAFTDNPDSMVVWVKFSPANSSGNDSARISAFIHDNYAFRDPVNTASEAHVYALARKDFPSTNGNWVRLSLPFVYSGPATSGAFMLITCATNKYAGNGSAGDELFIDDMELIYNPQSNAGVNEQVASFAKVVVSNGQLSVNAVEGTNGNMEVCNAAGQVIYKGELKNAVSLTEKGMYIVRLSTNKGTLTQKVMNF